MSKPSQRCFFCKREIAAETLRPPDGISARAGFNIICPHCRSVLFVDQEGAVQPVQVIIPGTAPEGERQMEMPEIYHGRSLRRR